VRFSDGRTGVVDFSEYLDRGGVFEAFRDIHFFRRFRVNDELGILTWEKGIDIAPEHSILRRPVALSPIGLKTMSFRRTLQSSGGAEKRPPLITTLGRFRDVIDK